MSDIFNLYNTVAGQATTTASAAASLPVGSQFTPSQTGMVLRVVTDTYLRLAFGNSSVSASNASLLFAPGEVYVGIPTTSSYYSALATTGTANYSISTGNVANISPVGY